MACALNDYAAELTEQYHQMLNEIGLEHTYYQAPGIHDYYFVDHALQWALENWLKLDKPQEGGINDVDDLYAVQSRTGC